MLSTNELNIQTSSLQVHNETESTVKLPSIIQTPSIPSTTSAELGRSPTPSGSGSLQKPYIHGQYVHQNEMNVSTLDKILEKEKLHNKTESWNKLDKTVKIQKLHGFAEKYGKDHALPMKEVKHLKMFFADCLEKNKLQKAKDVICDKETHDITSIPALHFNSATHNFTLKIVDAKRVSTLKSLTPKRVSEKNQKNETNEVVA